MLYIKYVVTTLSLAWLGFNLFDLWASWQFRLLYQGPTLPDEPEVYLLPTFVYRLGIAAGWTVLLVLAILCGLVGWTQVSPGPGPSVSFARAFWDQLTAEGWWLGLSIFAWTESYQTGRVWEDVTRAQDALSGVAEQRRSARSAHDARL
jgi:hypothetical protein